MAGIFRFQPSDLGTPTTQGGDIANSFMNSFLAVRQSVRADQGLANESKRIDMAQQQFQQQTEDRAYDTQVMRPMRENLAKLQIGSQVLNQTSEQQKIQLNAMEIGGKLLQKQNLQRIMGDMTSYTAANSATGAVGQVTSYGYASDKTPDDASLGINEYKYPTGAWSNKLTENSLAISPDIERRFAEMGIRQGDSVNLKLADGSVVTRNWDDRTMQDKEAIQKFGKPLRGRFDFYNQGGPDARDGTAVVGFERAGAPLSPEKVQTPSGTPVYVAAAASTDPVSVINSTFSPQQTKFLADYDQLQVIAAGADKEDALQAQLMLKQFEANPDFQKLSGQRNVMLNAAKAQSVITSSILGARQDQLVDFQKAYPQYMLNARPDGQIVPINKITGEALSPQEQVSFGMAWTKHSTDFKPKTNELGDTLAGKYAGFVATFEAGKNVTDTDEESMKLKRASVGAKAAMSALEAIDPTLGAMRRQQEAFAAAEAARLAAEKAAAPGAGAMATPQASTENMTVDQMREQKKKQDQVNLQLANMEDITGSVNTFAAKLAEIEGIPVSAVNIANDILQNENVIKPVLQNSSRKNLKQPAAQGEEPLDMPSGPARSLAGVGKMSAADYYAEMLDIPVAELKEWAKATTAKRGPATPAAGELTPEQKAFMDKLLKEQ